MTIRPCAYCKGREIEIWHGADNFYHIKCKNCGKRIQVTKYADAFAKWNEEYDRAYGL